MLIEVNDNISIEQLESTIMWVGYYYYTDSDCFKNLMDDQFKLAGMNANMSSKFGELIFVLNENSMKKLIDELNSSRGSNYTVADEVILNSTDNHFNVKLVLSKI